MRRNSDWYAEELRWVRVRNWPTVRRYAVGLMRRGRLTDMRGNFDSYAGESWKVCGEHLGYGYAREPLLICGGTLAGMRRKSHVSQNPSSFPVEILLPRHE